MVPGMVERETCRAKTSDDALFKPIGMVAECCEIILVVPRFGRDYRRKMISSFFMALNP